MGYQRIVNELKGLGIPVSATTMRIWLRAGGLGPSGTRHGTTWREFVRTHRHVFRSDGIAIVRTPFRTPQANGVAERFVRTVRSECLDWLLILNQAHLERVLEVFATHYTEQPPVEHWLSRHQGHNVHHSRRRLGRFVFTVSTASVV